MHGAYQINPLLHLLFKSFIFCVFVVMLMPRRAHYHVSTPWKSITAAAAAATPTTDDAVHMLLNRRLLPIELPVCSDYSITLFSIIVFFIFQVRTAGKTYAVYIRPDEKRNERRPWVITLCFTRQCTARTIHQYFSKTRVSDFHRIFLSPSSRKGDTACIEM